MTTPSSIPLTARADRNGLAVIGSTAHEIRGIRFDDGEGGANPATPAAPAAPAPAAATPPATPAAPAPGAAPEATPPAAAPAPAGQPAPSPQNGGDEITAPVGGVPFDQLPPETQAEVRRLRQADRANREAMRNGMTAETREQLGRALGFIEEPPAGAEEVTARVSELTTSLNDAQRANMVLLAAPDAGARAASLLDSRSFTESIAGLDPTDRAGITAAITQWVTEHPEHRATPAIPPAPGASRPAGEGTPTRKTGLVGAIADAIGQPKPPA